MAPYNSELSEKIWSEEDSNKESLKNFLNAASRELKAMYSETGASTLTDTELRKEIADLMKRPVPVEFRKLKDNASYELTAYLNPVYFEIKERTPGVYSFEQMVSIPKDEFAYLEEEVMEFAQEYKGYLDEEEKIEDMYAGLISDGELCTTDNKNYYFLLDPTFDDKSSAIGKIQYIVNSIKDNEEDEDID